MAELGVSEEQFVEACEKAQANPIHKKIVDQIMAVENFVAFKKLMVKRNEELNRQAIELFEKAKQGAQATDSAAAATSTAGALGTPAAAGDKPAAASDGDRQKQVAEMKEVMRVAHSLEKAEEEEMMKRALEESEKLKSAEQKAIDEEEEMIRQAIEASEREEADRKRREGQE